MANTTNFGFKKFPPGTIADDGNQFTLRDRDLFDALFFSLFNHDHSGSDEAAPLAGFDPLIFPTLTLGTAGTLPGGRIFYYKVSYLDVNGNETQASTTGTVSTPSPLAPPPVPSAVVATTGGVLTPGTYRYALSYYQGATLQTPATNILTVTVPTGTNTNQITLTLDTPPDAADGWKIYRRTPIETEYWLLDTVLDTATNYVDDGTLNADCTKRRPTVNTTNSLNSVTVAIPGSELPLDARVASWRIYRTETSSLFPANSLVATVSETTTQGGADLVTSYVDTGAVLGPGTPLQQTAIPPTIPQLDAGVAFGVSGGRLPSSLAPLAVSQHATFMPGTLVVQDYNQFSPQYDMLVSKLEGFALLAPTGVSGVNYPTIRVSDDATADEVQQVYVTTTPRNEVQQVVKSIAANTWTLTFDGQTTAAIVAAPTTTQIKTALEALSNITEVFVVLTGTRTWTVEFSNPGGQNVAQMTGVVSGGTITVTTLIAGSDGGTLTLSDGSQATTAIAFNASGATVATRLETDLTSIVDVTVTGTGTELDPWVITWVNPAATSVPVLQLNDAGLNGTGLVTRITRGHGPTVIDLDIQTAVKYHSVESPLLLSDSQEAEDAPAVSTGVDVSDGLASNGAATELTGVDTVEWPVGILDAGVYRAYFYVAPISASQVVLSVISDSATPVVLATMTVNQSRPGYEPAFELEFEASGTDDILLVVELVTGTTVRVDKFEWELILPTLHAGSIVTVEALVTGAPSTNGDNWQFSIWY